MKIIYIKPDTFECNVTDDGTMTAVETDFFDGKCDVFIEGYRFVPSGKNWIREDGVVFQGEMIAPWKDYSELDEEQRKYEKQMLADYESALSEIEIALGV